MSVCITASYTSRSTLKRHHTLRSRRGGGISSASVHSRVAGADAEAAHESLGGLLEHLARVALAAAGPFGVCGRRHTPDERTHTAQSAAVVTSDTRIPTDKARSNIHKAA